MPGEAWQCNREATLALVYAAAHELGQFIASALPWTYSNTATAVGEADRLRLS